MGNVNLKKQQRKDSISSFAQYSCEPAHRCERTDEDENTRNRP